MRKRKNKRKREKFLTILLKSLCVSTILSLLAGLYFYEYLDNTIREQCNVQLHENIERIQGYIMQAQKNYNGDMVFQEISQRMALYATYDIMIVDPLNDDKPIQITPYYSPDCYISAEIIDESNNVVASNRQRLIAMFNFEKGDKDNGIYSCDNEQLHINDIDNIYARYNNFRLINDRMNYVDLTMSSAYVNKKDRTFIPHEMYMVTYTFDDIYSEKSEKKIEDSFNITVDDDNYELIEFDLGNSDSYPKNYLFSFQGTSKNEMYLKERVFKRNESGVGGYSYDDDLYIVDGYLGVVIEGKEYTLYVGLIVNTKELQVVRLFWKWTISLAILLTLIALLYAWSRNVKNKAQYAFEDYQRALTNNLAHDLKTPLAVIGGYAENLMEMRRESSDEKELSYLSSIMDNVAYTDDIIRKTLKLSETEQKKKLNKTKVDIKALAEKCAEKYKDAIDERGIELEIVGSGEVTADEDSLSLTFDNLISNAVKYTRNDGSIKITASKKGFAVENDTAENVDTKELKMPFVKGDKARSDKSSSGLGLSIAEAAAVQNGFRLKISCKDKKFTARIDM
ncbi:sensor histidine kinase [Ruminococcus flavefaciens]|uniref:sensor histidine kinase n=1 Tax=Ruminococcus flavefaciens TaxID=1265 RepID=UPI0026EC96AF|nr:HAMP domain-containing sensor histidine kinase [Ruminococcus flavefaciens]MDD7518195.1 HAMP domain-containing sensor histidine kinase [Ruminococcus flavefaciens]MDY5690604.1 HAMP domain-containing sensor histidine kinase [Ruminococcus flavefaciens]